MSQPFYAIQIKTINSLESLSGGILVVVSGSLKSKEFSGRRKFMQTFLLAPQTTGFFVLNDIFHFLGEEVIQQHPVPLLSESRTDYQHSVPMYSEDRTDYQHQTPIYSENNVDYQHPGSTLQEDITDYEEPETVYLENRVDSQLTNSNPIAETQGIMASFWL